MSHVETEENNQVDYTPDSEIQDADEKEPARSCNNCRHKKVCYFLTRLNDDKLTFENSKICKLPYEPQILAMTCKMFNPENENGVQKDETELV